MRWSISVCLIKASLFLTVIQGLAQTATITPANAPAKFDVVSIRLSDPSINTENLNYGQGQIVAKGITLGFLIQSAYGIRDFQLAGLPRELVSEKYDITAKMDDPSKESSWDGSDPALQKDKQKLYQLRLQAVLADRFHLKLHAVTKSVPVFALVIGKKGPILQKTSVEEGNMEEGGYMRMHILEKEDQIEAKDMKMSDFTDELSHVLSRMVLDRTGLTDRYDFVLKWTPDEDRDADATGPSLYTALQEQLGLKLESQNGPVNVYVVDHIEKPSPN